LAGPTHQWLGQLTNWLGQLINWLGQLTNWLGHATSWLGQLTNCVMLFHDGFADFAAPGGFLTIFPEFPSRRFSRRRFRPM